MKRLLVSCLFAALATTGVVLADQTNDSAAAKTIIDKALARYHGLKTYQDKATARFEIVAKGVDGEDAGQSNEQSATLAFARPNRIAVASDNLSVYCDGQHLWAYAPRQEQYTETAAPASILLREVSPMPMFPMIQAHPAALMLAQPNADFSQLFPMVGEVKGVVAEMRNGQPGHRVFGVLGTHMTDSDEPAVTISFWFSDTTALLGELRIDFTESYKQGIANSPMYDEENKPPKVQKAQVVLSLNDVVLDADIPGGRFAFKPGSDAKKVEELSWGRVDESKQQELVGKPAPDISGKDFESKPLSLSTLRGRVVVLDFWAMWCGPCVQAIPHVQKIAERFAAKPVTVLGINRDPKGSDQKLKKFLDRKKITIRQFLDPDGEVSKQYQVNGIPCTVLIGTNGVIQSIDVGFRSDGEEYLGEQIERLMKGETLFDAKELATRRTKRDEETPVETSTNAPGAAITETNAESLVASSTLEVQANGYNARRVDVDGTGRLQWVLTDWEGGLRIVSPDGTQTHRVHFKGKGMGTQIKSFEPIHTGGTQQWLVAFAKYGSSGMSESGSVGLYNADGEPVWTYQPTMPEKVCCEFMASAGDLNGNGKLLVVAAMTTYNVRKRSENTWEHINSKAYLVILDESGKCLCQRRIGQRIEFVQVAPSGESGKPGSVLCLTDSKLKRFQWTPPASH